MFKSLFNMLHDGQQLTISLLRSGDKFIVGVFPQSANVKDAAKSNIIPLNLTGTPEELDNEFIATINTPLQRVSGILNNISEFEVKAEKAASESKALKEKQEKMNKAVKEAEALEADKPREALLAYKAIHEKDKHNSTVIAKIKALEEKLSKGSLFGIEEVKTIVSPSAEKPENRECGAAPVKTEEEVVSAVGQVPVTGHVQPVAANAAARATATSGQPVDMFAQVVEQAQLKEKTKNDVSPANLQVDPQMFAKFQAFMNLQQSAGQQQNQ